MRLLDQDAFVNAFKKDAKQAGIFFSILTGVLVFMLFVSTGFVTALLSGVVVFGLLFGTVYGIRNMILKGVERRKRKQVFDSPYIEVKFRNETGVLVFYNDVIRYVTLTAGAEEKTFEIPVTPSLFIASGEIEYTKFQSYRKRDIHEGFVLLRDTSHGIPYQIVFYNEKGSLDNVTEVIQGITQYVEQ